MKISGHEVTIINEKTAKVGCATVTLAEIEQLVKEMKEYSKLKVGDYVLFYHRHSNTKAYGKIVDSTRWGAYICEFPTVLQTTTDFLPAHPNNWPQNGHFISIGEEYLTKIP